MQYKVDSNPFFKKIEITKNFQEIKFYFSADGKKNIGSPAMMQILFSFTPESTKIGEFYLKIDQGFEITKMQPINELLNNKINAQEKIHTLEIILEQAKNHNILSEAVHQEITMKLRQNFMKTDQNNISDIKNDTKISANSILTQFNHQKITAPVRLQSFERVKQKSKKSTCAII